MKDIADELRDACYAAQKGDRVVSIHLFGIEHAARLKALNLKALTERAAIREAYGTELRKDVRLADHVTIIREPR